MDDDKFKSVHVDIVSLKKDIELLHKEIDLTLESMRKWQDEQDRRIEELEERKKQLQSQLIELTSRLDITQTKQQEYFKQVQENLNRQEDYKRILAEAKRDNKALWVPIIFSTILTILSALIPFLF